MARRIRKVQCRINVRRIRRVEWAVPQPAKVSVASGVSLPKVIPPILPAKAALLNLLHKAPTKALRDLYSLLWNERALSELSDLLRSYFIGREFTKAQRWSEESCCPCCPFSPGTVGAGCASSAPQTSGG